MYVLLYYNIYNIIVSKLLLKSLIMRLSKNENRKWYYVDVIIPSVLTKIIKWNLLDVHDVDFVKKKGGKSGINEDGTKIE